jgi:uncharacterized small protein (DUF1192 family)
MELGEQVTLGERPAARAAAPSTSAGLIAGFTERGATDGYVFCVSPTDAEDKLGGRLTSDPEVFDCIDAAFNEGASAVYVARVTGDNPVAATKDFNDAEEDAKVSLKFTARQVGEYGNRIKVQTVTEGGKTKVAVLFDDEVVEGTPEFATQDAAVAWINENSNWITAAKGVSAKLPKSQTLALSGGDAKLGAATGKNLVAALGRLVKDLGPGQVSAPNFRDEEGHLALLAHGVLNNRRALLDDEIEADKDELIENATPLSAAPNKGARYGAYMGQWAIIPGLTQSTTRQVPYSGVQMGIIARSEAEGNNPNKPAAGRKRGKARWALGLVNTWTAEEIDELDDAGVTCAILANGVPCTCGDRTLIDTDAEAKDWRSFAASRLVMAVSEETRKVLEGFEFEQIDGKGYVFTELQGEISGRACMPFYKAKALYGELPEEAFAVNTGPAVNTPASIEAEEIKAQVAIRISPKGGMLRAEIVNVPISESV